MTIKALTGQLLRCTATPVLVGLLASAALASPTEPPVINEETPTLESLDAWRAHIEPEDGDTRWLNIEWRPTLWQAAADARRLRKPIVLWAMNGHPMGCT